MGHNLRLQALQAAADLCFQTRQHLGLTRREFARVVGVTESSLRNLEADCSPELREAGSGTPHTRRPHPDTYLPLMEHPLWTAEQRVILMKAFRYPEFLIQGGLNERASFAQDLRKSAAA